MQGITSTGVGQSSLDVEGLVDQLVTAEGAPTQSRLDQKEVEIQTSISALGTFRGVLSDFQEATRSLQQANDFRKVATSSSDEDKIEISAQSDAQEGVYSVEVQQLAQSHRLTSEVFDSELEPIGTGSLSLQFGRMNPDTGQFVGNEKSTAKNLQITEENNSLRGLKAAINNSDFGVRASTINDGKGFRLVLTAEATGEVNSLRVVVNDNDANNLDRRGLSRLSYDPMQANGSGLNLIETATAQDAVAIIDGIEVTSSSNTIDNAIDGVSLKLKGVTDNVPVKLSTEFDIQGVRESITNFVTAYNGMMLAVSVLTGIDPETGVAGPLAGDSSIRGIAEQIRRVTGSSYNAVNDEYGSLASIGIDSQRDGTLTINEGKVQSAIEEDLLQVTKLFAKAGSSSDPLISYISAGDESVIGGYEVNITQLASQARYISAESSRKNNLRINAGENSLTLKVNGVTSNPITITAGRYETSTAVAEALQQAINNDEVFKREAVTVSVSAVADQFVITSKKFGSGSRINVVSADDGIRDLGIDPAEGIAGEDAKGTIGGLPADGAGQFLTGRGPAQGIKIEILGGKTGLRGNVTYSRGVAEQLSGMFDNFLGTNGLISSRNNGFNNRIEDISRQREQLSRRLAVSEKRFLTQFSNLDSLMGKMRSTSSFLTNQLAGLPGARKPDSK